ncbi:MAG: type II toxin-antitoxin system Phd/YefM family antitoxin [Oscillospiraceae bacterium]|nr:type II toxin-antitoxin system Phd/YefM family antitoxin [Oscillospiraceae bacterium]
MQTLPKVIPINELKNTAKISQTCKESEVPIVVTRNGYGEMVLMSIDLYEKTMAEVWAAALINESLERIASGESSADGFAFLDEMDAKYGD